MTAVRVHHQLTCQRTKVDKVSAELVTLTYGTIVAQLCKDFDSDYLEVNKQLDKMGYNIGMRLIEDFLAKANYPDIMFEFQGNSGGHLKGLQCSTPLV